MLHLGLEIVYPPKLPPPLNWRHQVDIVCVHGLGGGVTSTWHHDSTGKTWIYDPDFLGPLKDSARIMTYGYNADVGANMTSASVALHATELLGMLLTAYGRWGGGPLIFVCHGFGGHIVKRALLLAQGVAAYRAVADSMAAVVFLGTVHEGKDSEALLATVRNSALLLARKGSRPVAEDDLREFAEAIREVNCEFTGSKIASLDLVSCWEERPSLLSPPGAVPHEELIVPEACARLEENEIDKNLAMDCTHRDLPRFASPTEPRFRAFLEELTVVVREAMADSLEPAPLPLSQTLSTGPPLPPPPLPGPGPKPPAPEPKDPTEPPPRKPSEREIIERPERSYPLNLPDDQDARFRSWAQRRDAEDLHVKRNAFLASLRGWSEANFGNDIHPLPGTCKWIQSHHIFKRWASSSFSESLFVTGDPGCGKTHLAKATAAHLRATRPQDLVLEFYCNVETTDQRRPKILDYFVSQLLQLRPKWFEQLPHKYHDRTARSPPLSSASLADILHNLKNAPTRTTVFLFIDGTHRCDIKFIQDLLERLESLMDAVEPIVVPSSSVARTPPPPPPPPGDVVVTRFGSVVLKPFLTVFPNEAIILGSTDAPRIGVKAEDAAKDVAIYVDRCMEKFEIIKTFNSSSGSAADTLKAAAGHFFPYAKYSFAAIESSTRVQDAPMQLGSGDDCPEGLAHYYDHDILPLLQSNENNNYAKTALMLLVSAIRPLKPDEILDAISCIYDNPGLRSMDLLALLTQRCSRLLSILPETGLGVVHESLLVHFEAYLSKEERHANMLTICVKYLTQEDFASPMHDLYHKPSTQAGWKYLSDKYPFLQYAMSHWRAHLTRCGELAVPLLPRLRLFLADDSPFYKTWYHAHCWSVQQDARVGARTNPVLVSLVPSSSSNVIHHFIPAELQDGPRSWLQKARLQARKYLPWRLASPRVPPMLSYYTDFDGQNPLMIAAMCGQPSMIKLFLTWPLPINERSRADGSTALMNAMKWVSRTEKDMPANRPDPEAVILPLLQAGANPNIPDDTGATCLHFACAMGNDQLALLLLNHGANPNLSDVRGRLPIELAYLSDNLVLVRMLVFGFGAEIDIRDGRGGSLLHASIVDNNFDMFRQFVELCDVNALSEQGMAPLHLITKVDWLTELLNRPDLDLDLVSDALNGAHQVKWNALKFAIDDGNYNAVKMLLEHGALPGRVQMHADELFKAVYGEQCDIVELLLAYNAPVNVVQRSDGYRERTALASACYRKNARLVTLLLANGADPTVEEAYGLPGPLHAAVRADDADIVRLLLTSRVPPSVDYTPDDDQHILLVATRRNNPEVLKQLLACNPDMSIFLSGRPRWTPLHETADGNLVDLCDLLVQHEPQLLNARFEEGSLFETPLATACRAGRKEAVRKLLDLGADPALHNYHYQESPLLSACIGGKLDIVKMLYEAAPDRLNVPDHDGKTPLMTACVYGNVKVVEYLLGVGADLRATDHSGMSCVSSLLGCEDATRLQVLELLFKHGLTTEDVISARGLTVLGEACQYGDLLAVKFLIKKKGADVTKAQCSPTGNLDDPWVTALQVALYCDHVNLAEELLKPEYAPEKWLTQVDWFGENLLSIQPSEAQVRIISLIYRACERIRADTGDDLFDTIVSLRDSAGRSALDWSLFSTPTLPTASGVAALRRFVATLLPPMMFVERNYAQHSRGFEVVAQSLFALGGEWDAEGALLAGHAIASDDIVQEDDGLVRKPVFIYLCMHCEERVYDNVYYCRDCYGGVCGECRSKWGVARGLYIHDYVRVPITLDRDFNSEEVQGVLLRLGGEFVGPVAEVVEESVGRAERATAGLIADGEVTDAAGTEEAVAEGSIVAATTGHASAEEAVADKIHAAEQLVEEEAEPNHAQAFGADKEREPGVVEVEGEGPGTVAEEREISELVATDEGADDTKHHVTIVGVDSISPSVQQVTANGQNGHLKHYPTPASHDRDESDDGVDELLPHSGEELTEEATQGEPPPPNGELTEDPTLSEFPTQASDDWEDVTSDAAEIVPQDHAGGEQEQEQEREQEGEHGQEQEQEQEQQEEDQASEQEQGPPMEEPVRKRRVYGHSHTVDPDSDETSLSLAVLHAFGFLEFPRKAWGPVLPLAAVVRARIAPWDELIRPQRSFEEGAMWATEHAPYRNFKELQYFVSGGRRTDYVDVALLFAERALEDVQSLFVDGDAFADALDGLTRERDSGVRNGKEIVIVPDDDKESVASTVP